MTTTDPPAETADQIRHEWDMCSDMLVAAAHLALDPEALDALADVAATVPRAEPDDSIVIARAELPRVKIDAHMGAICAGSACGVDLHADPDDLRHLAYAYLALAERLDAQKPRPLAVGDRVRVVTPRLADGETSPFLAEGDVGTVVAEADEGGDLRFLRDGTEGAMYVAAANVERIEGQS